MGRHVFTADERRRGGLARVQSADFREMCSRGFWATMESHPFFARKHLRKLTRGDGDHRPVKQGGSLIVTDAGWWILAAIIGATIALCLLAITLMLLWLFTGVPA